MKTHELIIINECRLPRGGTFIDVIGMDIIFLHHVKMKKSWRFHRKKAF